MLKKSRRGKEGKRRWFSNRPPYFGLLLFFACFAGNSFSQDLESIRSAIASGNIELKRNALSQIKNLHTEAASRLALPALADAGVLVRATAASAVIFLPKTEAVSALMPLLTDKDEFVRGEAAFALGEVGDASAATALIQILKNDRSRVVIAATAAALGKIGHVSAVAPLGDTFRAKPNEDNEFLRRCSAHAIGLIAETSRKLERTTTTPENFLPDKYKNGFSLPAAVEISGFQAVNAILIKVLQNNKEADDTRREAAFALGAIGDASSIAELRAHLNSPDNYLGEICKEALLKMERQK